MVSHTPINNIGGQYRNQTIEIVMSTAVDPATIHSDSIKISTGTSSSAVLGTFTLMADQKTIRFQPALAFGAAGTQVNVHIDTFATQPTPDETLLLKSLEGRSVIATDAPEGPDPVPALDFKFFCGSFLEVDAVAPRVQSVVPTPAGSVPDNWPNIVVTFSEPMNPFSVVLDTAGAFGSFSTATVTMRVEEVNTVGPTGTKLNGTVEWNNIGTIMTFTPFAVFTINREIRLFLRSMDPALAAGSSCTNAAPVALATATYNTILDMGHPDDCTLGNRLDVPASITQASMTETAASSFILTCTFTTFTAPSKLQGNVTENFDNNSNESVLLTTAEWSNFIIDGSGNVVEQGIAESRRVSAGKTDGTDV
ncbi:MAG: hypothetical protein AAB131_21610, partial [Actinomycetota bacterium]